MKFLVIEGHNRSVTIRLDRPDDEDVSLEMGFRISITKWQLVTEYKSMRWTANGALGWRNCGLCLCSNFPSSGCSSCPVYKDTHSTYCDGTPYEDYYDHPTARSAKAELKYLIGLAKKYGFENLEPIEVYKVPWAPSYSEADRLLIGDDWLL